MNEIDRVVDDAHEADQQICIHDDPQVFEVLLAFLNCHYICLIFPQIWSLDGPFDFDHKARQNEYLDKEEYRVHQPNGCPAHTLLVSCDHFRPKLLLFEFVVEACLV